MSTVAPQPAHPAPTDEVVEICRRLIRIDTSNYGDGSGPGERAAAEYVAELLTDVGWEPALIASEPGRASVVLRIEGTDRSRPALVLHGHTDVVPAQAEDWQVDPFSAEVRDGMMGPRCRRHEGHGRDDPRRRPRHGEERLAAGARRR